VPLHSNEHCCLDTALTRRAVSQNAAELKQHFRNVTLENQINTGPTNVLPTPRRAEFAVTRTFDVEALLAAAPNNKVSQTSLETWRGTRVAQLGLSPRYPGSKLAPAEARLRGSREWSRQKDGRLTLPWRVQDDTHFSSNYTGFESREVCRPCADR